MKETERRVKLGLIKMEEGAGISPARSPKPVFKPLSKTSLCFQVPYVLTWLSAGNFFLPNRAKHFARCSSGKGLVRKVTTTKTTAEMTML